MLLQTRESQKRQAHEWLRKRYDTGKITEAEALEKRSIESDYKDRE